jgi:hypothetical protein
MTVDDDCEGQFVFVSLALENHSEFVAESWNSSQPVNVECFCVSGIYMPENAFFWFARHSFLLNALNFRSGRSTHVASF